MTYAPSATPPVYVSPMPMPMTPPGMIPGRMLPAGEMSPRDSFAARYGIGGKDSAMSRYQQRYQQQPPPVAPVVAAPAAAAPKPGLLPMLDERQLDVTIMVQIVKLLPPKSE